VSGGSYIEVHIKNTYVGVRLEQGEGCMGSMQWQLGVEGTIPAFAYWHRETKQNLCRDGRSHDLPDADV